MAKPTTKREEILDVAEVMMRKAGYNGFSTREVAAAVEIKPASVHYYFPTKSDIGAAVTERYTERFLETLGPPSAFQGAPGAALAHYIDSFRKALFRDGAVCLCAVLGAEIDDLPEHVRQSTKVFFERNLEWLTTVISDGNEGCRDAASGKAALVLAGLEGAMILSNSLANHTAFERAAERLLNAVSD